MGISPFYAEFRQKSRQSVADLPARAKQTAS
jgi:hypothetical protein